MSTEFYIVKQGDTLWHIASKYLGSPFEWPRLWKHNNRRDVISITGRGIPNPDLIYPGQKLLLPIVAANILQASTPQSDKPTPVKNHKDNQENKVKARDIPKDSSRPSLKSVLSQITTPVAFKYNLEDLKFPSITGTGVTIDFKLKGAVTLGSKSSYPITYVTDKREIEAKLSSSANTAFSTLVSDIAVNYSPKDKAIKVSMGLTAKSTTPNLDGQTIVLEASSNAITPKLVYKKVFNRLQGSIGEFNYLATDVILVVEISADDDNALNARELAPSNASNWDKVLAGGLVVAGTGIIVATLVEDYFTAGVGTIDNPASFGAAAALYARGAALWAGTRLVAQNSLIPALIRFRLAIVPAGALQYAH